MTTLLTYGFLVLAIIFETIATSFLKQSEQFTRLVPSLLCLCGYVVSFYFLSIVLKTLPVGIAYAIWSGLGIVFISFVGLIFFKQHLDLAAYIGLSCIILGVVIVNVFSTTVGH